MTMKPNTCELNSMMFFEAAQDEQRANLLTELADAVSETRTAADQAAGDRQILAKQLNISPHQLSYVTHSGEGEGLLFFGNVILPFVDRFPTDLELYKIMTTKLGEVSEGAQK